MKRCLVGVLLGSAIGLGACGASNVPHQEWSPIPRPDYPLSSPCDLSVDLDADRRIGAACIPPARGTGPCSIELDYDMDGRADEIHNFVYDLDDTVEERRIDEGGNLTHDWVVQYTVTPSGHLRTEVRNGGPATFRADYEYDDGDRLTGLVVDVDRDGTDDQIWRFIYDDEGRLEREEVEHATQGDRDNRYVRHFYDDEGNDRATRLEVRDVRGQLRAAVGYGYNQAGLLEAIEVDINGDGSLDRQWSYTYDDAQQLVVEAFDTDGDGLTDTRYEYEYTEEGVLTRITVDEGTDNDLEVDASFDYGCWTDSVIDEEIEEEFIVPEDE